MRKLFLIPSMTTRKNPEEQGDLALEERRKTKRPRKYHVVFHNDDYTTMEFVVHVLMKFFQKNPSEAEHIMLQVHHKGFGIVGIYLRDVAETKCEQVMSYAKQNGHPLKASAEPADDGENE